jgi:hypothetical protein
MIASRTLQELAKAIHEDGFVFLPRSEAAGFFGTPAQHGFAEFASSWDDLRPDQYMADGGRYRLRRHAVYEGAVGNALPRAAERAHFQTVGDNPLNGGIERWFEPVSHEAGEGAVMRALLDGAQRVFEAVADPDGGFWRSEAHQFRIVAKPGAAGKPTPEGMHRDGVSFVLVCLVARHNIAGGRTSICVEGRGDETSFTLQEPLDMMLLDDNRVWHGVTPVEALDQALPAYRDVLVLTYKNSMKA